jgi:CrcB protein
VGSSFPIGTLFVNAVGSALFGFLLVQLEGNPTARLLVLNGFLGAFTTFSTFSADTVTLMLAQAWRLALLNVGANVLISLGLCGLGIWCAKTFFSPT